ncbi:hypothetical protein BGZ52_000056 [Haplosporangium bisporale]|nr:hypothetical protein BGZ52_000056 [Haplosporangium bisporale]
MTKLDTPKPATGPAAEAVQKLLVQSVMTTVDGVAYSTDSWTNWGGNVTSKPERTFHPKTLTDLQVIVREASAHNKKIRCAGSGHSFSAAAATNDYLVDVKGMNKIYAPVPCEDGYTVTIEMGVLVSELDNVLRQHNPPLSLPSNVVPGVVRYGGVLTMGCHGASVNASTVSDMITEMTIVNAKGELVTYSEAKDPEAFSAACLNLGLLGIVYTATLKVEVSNTRLRVTDSYPSLKSVFHGPDAGLNLKAMVLKNDSTSFLYWPFKRFGKEQFNDEVWLMQWERTTEQAENKEGMVDRPPMVDNPFFAFLQVGERIMETADAIHFFPIGDGMTPVVDAGVTTVVDAGVAFKVDANFSNVVEAFNDLVERNYRYSTGGSHLVDTALEMRFIRASSKIMSPAYDQDPDAIYCMLDVMAPSGAPGFEEYSTKVLADWMKRFDAKPHWPKMWEAVPDVYPYLHRAYGDRLVRFNRIRKDQDPKDMFVNRTFEKLVAGL